MAKSRSLTGTKSLSEVDDGMYDVSFSQNTYYKMLGKQLCKYYNSNTYSDVTITVSGRKFYGHKIILSLVSTYFDAMFRAGMRETQTGEVTLQDVAVEAFELVLEYVYTGEVELTVDVAQDLLQASNMFQILPLTDICATFMANHVTANNCFELLQVADRLSLENLYHTVKMFILDEFDHLVGLAMEGIVHLSKDLLIDLIQDDYLNSKHETEVYECVMKWIEHDESRMQYLSEVFQYVRFPLLPSDYFIGVNNNTTLRSDPTCLSYINEALEYHMLPSKSLSGGRTHLRKKSGFKDVAYIIRSKTPPISISVHRFNLNKMSVKPYYSSEVPCYGFSACHYNGSVYLCGGYNNNDTEQNAVRKVDLSTRHISECASMPHPRAGHQCIVLGDLMFVIGGDGIDGDIEDTIDIYNFDSKSWQTFASAKLDPYAYGGTIIFHDKIYIFGGMYSIGTHDQKIELKENIFSFDPRAEEEQMFETLCSIPNADVRYSRAVVVGERIFVLQSYLDKHTRRYCKYFLYSPANDCLTDIGEAPHLWWQYDLVCYEEYVFVIGTIYDVCRSESREIHCYNIKEDKWEIKRKDFSHKYTTLSATDVIRIKCNSTKSSLWPNDFRQ